jgi:uncharacterized protein
MAVKTHLLMCGLVCASVLVPGVAEAATAPINCKKASTPVAEAICASPELVAMDREVAALYDRGLADLSGDERRKLAESQAAFVKARAGCAWAAHHSAHPGEAVNECIRDKMEIRVRALRGIVDHH